MNVQEYKSRLYSILTRVEPILESCGHKADTDSVKGALANSLEGESTESESKQQLDVIKESIIALLKDTLTEVQIAFVEMEEPNNTDSELFKKHLLKLKDLKQELSSPVSETRKQVSSILRRSKANLVNEISSQAIIFPTECLDTILACPEVEQQNGDQWVLEQINETLNTLLEEVNTRLGASFDAVNEILGSEIDALHTSYKQVITLGCQSTTTMADEVFGVARQTLPAIGIGGLSSTLVATLINPIVGIVTGLAAGGMFIWKSCSSSNRQKKVMELKQQLAPKITLAMNELKTYVIERYDEFEEGIGESIETMNELISKEMQDCVDALKSCEQDSKNFYSSQVALNNKMTALETYIKQLEILMSNPFDNK